MREDDAQDGVGGHFLPDHRAGGADEFARTAAYRVDAQDLAVLLADKHLDCPVLPRVVHDEAAGHGHRLHNLPVGNPLRLKLLLRGADLRDLGVGENHRRNRLVAHPVADAEHVVDCDDALAGGGVRQEAAARDVAAGPDAGDARLAEVVGDDALAVHVDLELLKPQPLGDGAAASGVQDVVAGDLLLLAVGVKVEEGRALDLHNLAIQVDFDSAADERLGQELADLVVHHGRNLRHHLHDGDFRAGRAEEIGELEADDAAADDHQRLRELVKRQDSSGIEDERIVAEAGDWGACGDGARRNQDVCALVGFSGRLDLARCHNPRLGLHDFDAGGLLHCGHSLDQLRDHLLLARLHGRHVKLRL